MTDTTDDDAPQDRTAELERRLAELESSTTARLVRAELKAEAIRAGMVDLDGLKMIDTAGLKLNDAGEVAGAVELMRDLRRSKPWLFGGASSSSSARPPQVLPPEPKTVKAMTRDEWQAARATLLKRR